MKWLALSLFALTSSVALAQPIVPSTPPKTNINVTLAWDPSPSTNVTGYIIRRGTAPGQYVQMMTVAASATTAVWTNAPKNATNYFVASAFTATGLESDPSNEIALNPVGPLPPALRTAVPITVYIESKTKDGEWVIRHVVGPLYTMTENTNEMFRTRLTAVATVQVMPPN